MSKTISSKNIRNFLKLTLNIEVYEYQLEFAFDEDFKEFTKDWTGNFACLKFERFQKPMHYLVVSKDKFKLIVEGKEKDLSQDWLAYRKDENVDMHLEYLHGGSRFG